MGAESQRKSGSTAHYKATKVEEKHDPVEVKKRSIFDALIERKLCTAIKPPKLPIKDFDDEWEEFENGDEKARSIPEIEDTVYAHGRLLN